MKSPFYTIQNVTNCKAENIPNLRISYFQGNLTILSSELGPGWLSGLGFNLNLPVQITVAYHLYIASLRLGLYHTKKGCL